MIKKLEATLMLPFRSRITTRPSSPVGTWYQVATRKESMAYPAPRLVNNFSHGELERPTAVALATAISENCF